MNPWNIILTGAALLVAPTALTQPGELPWLDQRPAVSALGASPDASVHPSQQPSPRGLGLSTQSIMERLDANGDGIVAVSELAANVNAQRWAAADADGNGILSIAEVDAVREAWREGRGPVGLETIYGVPPEARRPSPDSEQGPTGEPRNVDRPGLSGQRASDEEGPGRGRPDESQRGNPQRRD